MTRQEINRRLDAIDSHVLRLQAAVDELRAELNNEEPPPPLPMDEPLSSPRLFSVDEAAQRLGVSDRFIWQLLAEGDLERIKIGRKTKVSLDDLAGYIESHRGGRRD